MESLRLGGVEQVNAMTLTIQTAKENLAKAREDVQFWENALRLLSDPRIANGGEESKTVATPPPTPPASPRPYGELKRRVFAALPEWNQTKVVNTKWIVAKLQADGFVFASKTPAISVNEALVTLEGDELAFMGLKKGVSRYWKKGAKSQAAPEEAA